MLLLWLSLAWAEPGGAQEVPPRCAAGDLDSLSTPPERLAVAWVGPWRRQPRGWLKVVPARELAGWVAEQDPAWAGRTLQRLGLRKRNKEPRRRFKVVIFDIDRADLCRPVLDVETGEPVGGVAACRARLTRPASRTTGCGHTLDRRTGEAGFTQLAIKHRTARDRGSCTVPLERYLEQGGR